MSSPYPGAGTSPGGHDTSDVHITQRHPSPRFAKAYEILRRREEMKRQPEPAPPAMPTAQRDAQRDARSASSTEPEPDGRAPIASPRPRRRTAGRSSGSHSRPGATELDVTEDDFTSDAFSDVSAPTPRRHSHGSSRRVSGRRHGTAPAPATALSRLAVEEGLDSDGSSATGTTPRRYSTGKSAGSPPRAASKLEHFRRQQPVHPGSHNTTTATAHESTAASTVSPKQQHDSPRVARELAAMQRQFNVALSELGRHREAAARPHAGESEYAANAGGFEPTTASTNERPTSPSRHHLSHRAPPRFTPPTPRSKSPAANSVLPPKPTPRKASPTASAVRPRYRDPLIHRGSALSSPAVSRSPSATVRRTPDAANAGRILLQPRLTSTVGRSTSAGHRAVTPARSTSAAGKHDHRARKAALPPEARGPAPDTVRHASVTPPRSRGPSRSPSRDHTSEQAGPANYTVKNYSYSRRLLGQHETARKARLRELRDSTMVSSSAAALLSRHQTDDLPQVSAGATPNARPAIPSRSASAVSSAIGGGGSHRHTRKTWAPSPTRIDTVNTQHDGRRSPAALTTPAAPLAHQSLAAGQLYAPEGDDGFSTASWSTVPLSQYVTDLLLWPKHRVRREIESCLSPSDPRCWMALTVIANHPGVVANVIVPMLLEELEHRDASLGRLDHLLCALAGIGPTACAALPSLSNMLTTGVGDRKLVALAIRCVGGAKAIDELIRLMDSSSSPAARATAAYALGLLSEPVVGHTVAVAVQMHRPSRSQQHSLGRATAHSVSLFRLGTDGEHVADGHSALGRHDGSGFGAEGHHAIRAKPPAYAPTHVAIDFAVLQRQLLQYFASPQCAATSVYTGLPSVLSTFCSSLAFLDTQIHVDRTAPRRDAGAALLSALTPLLSSSGNPTLRLSGSYAGRASESNKTGQRVVDALLHRLSMDGEDPSVRCQGLLALCQLPRVWAMSALVPVLTLAGGRLGADANTAAATARCLGALAARHTDRRAQASAVDQLAQWVSSGATMGVVVGSLDALGAVGPAAASAAPVAFEVLTAVLDSGAVDSDALELRDACARCLVQLGASGSAHVLSVIRDVSRDPSVRGQMAAALTPEALAKPHDKAIAALVDIVGAEPANDVLLRAVVGSIAQLAFAQRAVPLQGNEEAAVAAKRLPALPCADVLLGIVERPSEFHLASRLAAADAVARHGGAQGEASLIQLLLRHSDPGVRASAANVLVHSNGSPTFALLLAMNDTADLVRDECLASLARIGVPTVVSTLKGPQRSRLAAALRSCNDFLQFQSDEMVVAIRDELAIVTTTVSLPAYPHHHHHDHTANTTARTPTASTVTVDEPVASEPSTDTDVYDSAEDAPEE